jgi:hypothetical protein
MLDDQEKIKIAREYFMRADQGRPDILELFQEDAKVYFPNSDLDLDRSRFLKWSKDSKAPWNSFNTITTV